MGCQSTAGLPPASGQIQAIIPQTYGPIRAVEHLFVLTAVPKSLSAEDKALFLGLMFSVVSTCNVWSLRLSITKFKTSHFCLLSMIHVTRTTSNKPWRERKQTKWMKIHQPQPTDVTLWTHWSKLTFPEASHKLIETSKTWNHQLSRVIERHNRAVSVKRRRQTAHQG